jgi:hypothetical protein
MRFFLKSGKHNSIGVLLTVVKLHLGAENLEVILGFPRHVN